MNPPEPFDALIFDCDGTLADTAPLHFEGLRRAFEVAGVRFEKSWYLERVGLSRDEFFEEVRRSFDVDVDEEQLMRAHDEHFLQRVRSVRPVEDVVAIVRRYAGEVPLAVASGGRRHQVEATLEATSLRPMFDVVVAAEDVERGKPAPDIFLEATERLGVSPAACIVYEDSREGLEAASRAGMRTVHVQLP